MFDLYLTATMLDAGLSTLVTANAKDFRLIAGIASISVVDLATLAA